MHIKWVLNWEAFKYPQQFNESWGTAGTVIRTKAQMIKVTVEASGKQSVTHSVSLKAHFSPCQTKTMAGGLSETQGHPKIM